MITIKQKDRKPGDLPPNKLGCYDRKGQLRGVVGPRASSVTVARHTGQLGAKLTTINGRPAWANETLAQASAEGPTKNASVMGTNPQAIAAPEPKPASMTKGD